MDYGLGGITQYVFEYSSKSYYNKLTQTILFSFSVTSGKAKKNQVWPTRPNESPLITLLVRLHDPLKNVLALSSLCLNNHRSKWVRSQITRRVLQSNHSAGYDYRKTAIISINCRLNGLDKLTLGGSRFFFTEHSELKIDLFF